MSCATVLLFVSNGNKSSSMKLVTSISENSNNNSTHTSKNTTTSTKESQSKKQSTTKRVATSAKSNKTKSTTASVKFPVDINKVTIDELIQIDGVGEVTANKILSYRNKHKYYSNLLQLKEIDGIGNVTYKKLKKYLYVSKDKYKEITETSVTTTKAKTTAVKAARTEKGTKPVSENQMKIVNINTADKEELMDCLLMDEETALEIIDYREKKGGKYSTKLELIYPIGKIEYTRIKDYVTI